MLARPLPSLGVLALVAALAACGPAQHTATSRPATPAPGSPLPAPSRGDAATPGPSPAAGSTGNPGAPDPGTAVRAILPSSQDGSCYPRASTPGEYGSGCPVTSRLRSRLLANPMSGPGGGADPVCRCQNANPKPTLKLSGSTAITAEVTVDFGFPGNPDVVRFTVMNDGGGWLVDDTDCGATATSIYASPVKPCFAPG